VIIRVLEYLIELSKGVELEKLCVNALPHVLSSLVLDSFHNVRGGRK
jgi:hypothetical protein